MDTILGPLPLIHERYSEYRVRCRRNDNERALVSEGMVGIIDDIISDETDFLHDIEQQSSNTPELEPLLSSQRRYLHQLHHRRDRCRPVEFMDSLSDVLDHLK